MVCSEFQHRDVSCDVLLFIKVLAHMMFSTVFRFWSEILSLFTSYEKKRYTLWCQTCCQMYFQSNVHNSMLLLFCLFFLPKMKNTAPLETSSMHTKSHVIRECINKQNSLGLKCIILTIPPTLWFRFQKWIRLIWEHFWSLRVSAMFL